MHDGAIRRNMRVASTYNRDTVNDSHEQATKEQWHD